MRFFCSKLALRWTNSSLVGRLDDNEEAFELLQLSIDSDNATGNNVGARTVRDVYNIINASRFIESSKTGLRWRSNKKVLISTFYFCATLISLAICNFSLRQENDNLQVWILPNWNNFFFCFLLSYCLIT